MLRFQYFFDVLLCNAVIPKLMYYDKIRVIIKFWFAHSKHKYITIFMLLKGGRVSTIY